MKCIKAVITHGVFHKGDIIKAHDDEAFERVKSGEWVYASKHEFRAQQRLKAARKDDDGREE